MNRVFGFERRKKQNQVSSSELTVITAIMGDYDDVPPIPEGFGHAVLVSDIPIKSDWTNVVLKTGLPDRLASKIPKFRPDHFVQTNASVWIDASLRDPNNWLSTACKEKLLHHDFAVFQHPDRNTVTSEVIASRDSPKYDPYPLEEQVDFYMRSGFKDDVGLYACGVIARNHSLTVIDFGNEWFLENVRWSIQDQLSFSYLIARRGISVGKFSEHLWDGPLSWNHHKRPYS